MAGFKSTFDVLQFDSAAWNLLFQAQIEELLKGAARAFLIAASKRIKVRTGFLRGSFGNLAAAVTPVELSPIVPTVRHREYYRHTRGSRRRVLKTPTSGVAFTNPVNPKAPIFSRAKRDALDRASGNIAKTSPRATGIYTFTMTNLIRYLDINDKRLGWNSWAAGRRAFDSYLAKNLSNTAPDVIRFTLRSKSTLQGTSIRESKFIGRT